MTNNGKGRSCLKTTARSMRQGTRSTIEKNGAQLGAKITIIGKA
ncbi:hypothetical protein [Rhizobium gallicum]|nr:hypothetical protein [Rhizobium gallicum]